MRRSLLLVGMSVFLGTGCAHFSVVPLHADRTFSRTREGTFTHLELQSASGTVHVRGVPGAKVEVAGRVTAWAMGGDRATALAEATAASPPIEASGEVLRVGKRHERLPWSEGYTIDYEITVPTELAASIDSASGEVDVRELHGGVAIESASGDVKVSQAGPTRIHSASGTVRLTGIAGDLTVESSSGDVRIESTPSAGARWRIDVSSGNVTLLVAETAAFHLDAETSSGTVNSDLPLQVRGTLERGELHAEVGNGPANAQVAISTASGDVRLRH